MNKRVVVIGGGPSGMMAAGTAAKYGCNVILIEKNKILGRKLLITGKGRCNVTNFCDIDNVLSNINSPNKKFMYSCLNAFDCYDAYAFFEELGVPLKVERGNRVFPVTDKAVDVRDAFKKYINQNNVVVKNETVVKILANPFRVITNSNEYTADAVVVATGGLSYPLTGSTGDGYRFAKEMSHTVTKTSPSLVALRSSDCDCADMAGLSLKNISITVTDVNNKIVYTDFGELLFTHTGVSGPVILSCSSKLDFKNGGYKLSIDLKPALTEQELDARILRDFGKYTNKDFSNSLFELLPRTIIPSIINRCEINPHQKVNTVTKKQRKRLVNIIKSFELFITSKAGYNEAVITSGGVSLDEINAKTMESKLVKGLYFTGEILDVDANTGGYNLQIAYSTGYTAGKSIGMEK